MSENIKLFFLLTLEEKMKSKSKIFDLSAISIIACDCLQAVICIFIDLFFISRILNNPNATVSQNIVNIGLFYIIDYLIIGLSYSITGYALKKINKSIFVCIGSVFLTGVVFMVYLLSKYNILIDFIPLIAVFYGIGFGFFSSGYNNLTAETISSKHQVRFFAVKRIMFQLTYIVFPISLGYLVEMDFTIAALIMLAVCVLLIVFSCMIRPKKSYPLSFKLRDFGKYLKEHKKETKPLWLMYITNFFRGASYDCFTTLITILVMRTFDSNASLGTFQSIFTACSLLTMFFYLRFYRKKRANWFIIPTIVSVTATIIAIFCATNKTTIIIFYAVYSILNVILMSISDSRRAGVVRVLSLHSHILESNAFSEFSLAAGRVLSSVFLLLSGVFDSLVGESSVLFLEIAIGLVCLMYIMYGVSLIWLEKALIKQDEEFKMVHVAEEIVKTED